MNHYYLHKAKVSVSQGGFACGPVDPSIVASVLFSREKDENHEWLHCVEFLGIPTFYATTEDIHDELVSSESDSFWENLNASHLINEFEGIILGEYDQVFSEIDAKTNNDAGLLLRYVIALVRCEMEDIDTLVGLADSGADVASIIIPESDVEADYREKNE